MTNPTVVVLLESARAARDRAQRARQLMEIMESPDVVESLIRHAEELEANAHDLEQRAAALAETIAHTETVSAEIHDLVKEAKKRLRIIKSMKPTKLG